MNLQKVIDSNKLYDLYNQIFDYFSLTIYDLESKLDTNLNIENFYNFKPCKRSKQSTQSEWTLVFQKKIR